MALLLLKIRIDHLVIMMEQGQSRSMPMMSGNESGSSPSMLGALKKILPKSITPTPFGRRTGCLKIVQSMILTFIQLRCEWQDR